MNELLRHICDVVLVDPRQLLGPDESDEPVDSDRIHLAQSLDEEITAAKIAGDWNDARVRRTLESAKNRFLAGKARQATSEKRGSTFLADHSTFAEGLRKAMPAADAARLVDAILGGIARSLDASMPADAGKDARLVFRSENEQLVAVWLPDTSSRPRGVQNVALAQARSLGGFRDDLASSFASAVVGDIQAGKNVLPGFDALPGPAHTYARRSPHQRSATPIMAPDPIAEPLQVVATAVEADANCQGDPMPFGIPERIPEGSPVDMLEALLHTLGGDAAALRPRLEKLLETRLQTTRKQPAVPARAIAHLSAQLKRVHALGSVRTS